jgi:hypothetical protein
VFPYDEILAAGAGIYIEFLGEHSHGKDLFQELSSDSF